jgi:hypothetical protein
MDSVLMTISYFAFNESVTEALPDAENLTTAPVRFSEAFHVESVLSGIPSVVESLVIAPLGASPPLPNSQSFLSTRSF